MKSRFFLDEILIATTTTSILLTFIFGMDRSDNYNYTIYWEYQPLRLLPLYLQIPLWFGVFCSAGVLGTAMIDGIRFLIMKRDRPYT
jgi:hypothetical protein